MDYEMNKWMDCIKIRFLNTSTSAFQSLTDVLPISIF